MEGGEAGRLGTAGRAWTLTRPHGSRPRGAVECRVRRSLSSPSLVMVVLGADIEPRLLCYLGTQNSDQSRIRQVKVMFLAVICPGGVLTGCFVV